MIEADIWQDEKISTLDFAGRLFFIGLITHANDYGKLRGNPQYLKSAIFPYDDNNLKIQEYIDQLKKLGIIFFYEINCEKFIKIKNWAKYQTLTYKGKDSIPEPTLNKPLINPEPTLNKPLSPIKAKLSKDKLNKERIAHKSGLTPASNTIPEIRISAIRNFYLKAKGLKAEDFDNADYARTGKAIKLLILKAKGIDSAVLDAIIWVSKQNYCDWTLETVLKKWADTRRPICNLCKGRGVYTSGSGYEIKCKCKQ